MFWFYTIMENNISKINFTSNIRFVSYPKYKKLAGNLDNIAVHEMYSIDQVRDIDSLGTTEEIICCLAGTINLLKKAKSKIFHWFPSELFKDHPLSKKRLKEIGDYIQNTKNIERYKIVAIGGISKAFPGNHFLSLKCLGFFKRKLKEVNPQNITLFFAQNAKGAKNWKHTPESALIYNKKSDTYYVNCRKFIYNIPEDSKDHTGYWKDLLDKDEIKEHFSLIIASPKDKFFAGKKAEEIPYTFWRKNELLKKENKLY